MYSCLSKQWTAYGFSKTTTLLILSTILLLQYGCSEKAPIHSLELAKKGIYAAALPLSGSKAVISSGNHGTSLWDLTHQERLYNWNHSNDSYTIMSAVDISDNQKIGITAKEHQYVLWDIENGQSLEFRSVPGEISAIQLSKTGAHALVGLKNYTCLFIDTLNNQTLLSLSHKGAIRSVAFSTMPATLIQTKSSPQLIALTSADDNTAKLWDLNTGKLIYSWEFANIINHVDLSPNGQWSLLSSQHDRWLLHDNTETYQSQAYLSINSRSMAITASKFSADSNRLLIGGTSRKIELWDIETKTKVASWRAPKKDYWSPFEARIMEVGFNAKQDSIYTITSTGMLYSWIIPPR